MALSYDAQNHFARFLRRIRSAFGGSHNINAYYHPFFIIIW
jgi:hypothetical protein